MVLVEKSCFLLHYVVIARVIENQTRMGASRRERA